MNRRGFLSAILAASVAPAVVRAASLMPVRALDSGVVVLDPRVLVDGVPLASHTLAAPLMCRTLVIEDGATLYTAGQMVFVQDRTSLLGGGRLQS